MHTGLARPREQQVEVGQHGEEVGLPLVIIIIVIIVIIVIIIIISSSSSSV